MSDTITIHNGGEAPHAARGIAGTAGGGELDALMQQSGGQAPDFGTGGQLGAPADTPPQATTGDEGGAPPVGGAVHRR
jgi:hypothetical protein